MTDETPSFEKIPPDIVVLDIFKALPPFLATLLEKYPGTYLAGGFLRSLYDRTVIADYDLFFRSEEIANQVIEYLGTQNIAFRCPEGKLTTFKMNGTKVQAITPRYYADAYDLIETFDIRATQMALYYCDEVGHEGWNTLIRGDAAKDACNRRINLATVMYPIATINRIRKYLEKGYTISEEVWQDLLRKIRSLDEDWLNNPDSTRLYID